MKLIVRMIRENFKKMLNQYAVDNQSHVASQPVFFPPHPDPGGMLSRSLGMLSRNDRPPSILGHAWYIGKRFCKYICVFFSTLSARVESWCSNVSEHTSPHVMSESKTPVQDQRCQSGPSAINSVVPCEGGFSKNYGADQQRLQISDPHFDKFSTQAKFACWKIRFKTEMCTCSQFPTEAMHWIKEVEMVDSVDDFQSSSSVRGIRMPNFEELDARIASALNRIIHNSHSLQKKGQSGGTKGPNGGPFPSRKTDCLLELRVLPGHWSQRFCRELCRPIYGCSSKFRNSIRNGWNFITNHENPI